MFPISQWNVNYVSLANVDRTNYQTEGWNHILSKLIVHNRPNIWVLKKKSG